VAFLGFHHVQLAMPAGGEADAVAFYRDVLGFEEVGKPQDLSRRGGCWFRSGRVELHLGVEDPFAPARKAHPAILVDHLEPVQRRLAIAGVETVLDVQLEGFRRFYVTDPFGNRLELIEERAR
jgi:catechol 2,3-dioxygenase-like lactoylglutathione lyase family enzyme